MKMNREQLKEALLDLAKQEPGFLRDLIGEVIQDNLVVDSANNGDFDSPSSTYVLMWKDSLHSYHEFSRAC